MTTLNQARTILHEWVQSESLRKHCEAVSASMQHMATIRDGDPELWGVVGLLHDMDYERYPVMGTGPENHPFAGVAWLREQGWSEEICRAILSHASYSGVSRDSDMEKCLFAVDELSGFVGAVALVKPSKSLDEVDVASVKKKMKDKAFARAVSREDIIQGAEGLGVTLDDLIGEVITALRAARG